MADRKNRTTKVLAAAVAVLTFAAVFLYVKGIAPQKINGLRIYQTEPFVQQDDGTEQRVDTYLYEAQFMPGGEEFYIRKTENTDWEYLMQGSWSFVEGSLNEFLLTDKESGRGVVVTIRDKDFYFYDEARGKIEHFIRKS